MPPVVPPGVPPPPPGYAPPPAAPSLATIFLKLEGMLSADMLAADDEYEEIRDDIKQECESSGKVADVKMPRTGPLAGTCFVKFEELSAAAKARDSLDKRQFDGNVVRAVLVAEEEYAAVASS